MYVDFDPYFIHTYSCLRLTFKAPNPLLFLTLVTLNCVENFETSVATHGHMLVKIIRYWILRDLVLTVAKETKEDLHAI